MEGFDREMALCDKKIWRNLIILESEAEFSPLYQIFNLFDVLEQYLKWWLNAAHKQRYILRQVC